MGKKGAEEQRNQAIEFRDQAIDAINDVKRQELANPFAGFTSEAENLTNAFNNLRVNTTAAEFQTAQNDQSLANTLDAIRQGGGNSSANATALARSATQANQQIAVGIAKQENANRVLQAQGQAQLDQFQARSVDVANRLQAEGAKYVQDMYETRESEALAGLGQQVNLAQESLNSYYNNKAQTTSSWIDAGSDILGKFISDRRVKENIEKVGESEKGFPIYEFDYIGKEGRYRGTIAQEVPANVQIQDIDGLGHLGVNYAKTDIIFERIA